MGSLPETYNDPGIIIRLPRLQTATKSGSYPICVDPLS